MKQINFQHPEKKSYSPNGLIEVHSIFHTIQGEGPFCGTPAIFVRLSGCNLQCPQCDTEYTSKRDALYPHQILERIGFKKKSRLVVITGGEPFRQDIAALITQLIYSGYYVQVETNGTFPAPPLPWNKNIAMRQGAYIVVSPKTGKINPSIEMNACAYKYVVSADAISVVDGLPTSVLGFEEKTPPARPVPGLPIYLQPLDEKEGELDKVNWKATVKSCMDNGYILQLQIHKLIGVE